MGATFIPAGGADILGTANTFTATQTFSADPGITLSSAASRIVPGATSLSFRNNANSADNLIITDAGAATIRTSLTVSSGNLTATTGNLTLNGADVGIDASGGTVHMLFKCPASGYQFNNQANNAVVLSVTNAGVATFLSDVVLSTAALATNATAGFTYLPTSAGVPTGVATTHTGTVATEYDTTSNLLWVYNGAWKAPGQQLTVGDAGLLTISQATTYYAGEVGVSTTEANVQFPVSVPCTFSRMYVKLSGNVGGSGQTVTVTARLNGAGQTLTTTINTGASTGNDTTNSFSAVAGDLISFSVVTSATTGSFSQISITVCR